jgi:myo-inositol-1(or 4)-monophosphatase
MFTALRAAGALLVKNFDKPGRISFKNNSPINLVTEVDKASDTLIRKILHRAYPMHDLMTEESEPTSLRSPYRWIVDPLDGTTNYAHRFPQACVSIGLEERGRVILGGVYDPFRDELFWAAQGKGAWLIHRGRARRIRVSKTARLQAALLMTGFPYDRRERIDFYMTYFREFKRRIQGIRRLGAAALDLCWIACGRIDGYWEWQLKPWDCAAGQIIVQEAGGKLSDYAGASYSIYGEQTLATNGHIHKEMVAVMRQIARRFKS